ncbi:glycerophosphodiester phosphodiesterase family protein [Serratia sp. DD3]|uniref:glycerophosphodiester phosphodiesterase family protein n=1 Tax=Serratia sp. DD3 TaxID=1410619 RepID=UPI0004D34CEB|nr:glycerophosphodiester phosphodiesterase family protein [Serratia sp. DD3]KEY57605.1 glycerophosphoryl diester phosphodiesterase [Serratia sp. DD3]
MRNNTIVNFSAAALSAMLLVGCDSDSDTKTEYVKGDTEYVTKTEYVEPELKPIKSPVIIAHRGASGYLPEHTLGAYELAVKMGAEYIEPDLQLTKDGVLVAVHDNTLARTTDVLDRFGARNDSTNVGEYTLAEIKQLEMKLNSTAKYTYPGFTPVSNDPFKVPTFDEVIELAQRLSKETGKEIGIYPEAKLKDAVQEDKILESLEKYGYTEKSKIFIQSFSAETLRSLKNKMQNRGYLLPLVQLGNVVDSGFNDTDYSANLGVDCQDYCVLTQDNPPQVIRLADIKEYAPNIGVSLSTSKALTTSSSWPLYTPGLYTYAHDLGMTVTGWTFGKSRADALSISEYLGFFELGMDGFFSNYPDIAVEAKALFIETQKRLPSEIQNK